MTQPKLRFAQFDGDWEIKEFDKITERVSKASVKSDLPRIEYEDVISGSGVLNKDVYQKNNIKKGTNLKLVIYYLANFAPICKIGFFQVFKALLWVIGGYFAPKECRDAIYII